MVNEIYGDVLVFLYEKKGNSATLQELHNRFGAIINGTLTAMVNERYLDFNQATNVYRLQARGRVELSEYYLSLQKRRQEQARQEAAKQQEQAQAVARQEDQNRKTFRHDYLVAVFEAGLAFLAGVLVEHYAQLYQRVLDLLR